MRISDWSSDVCSSDLLKAFLVNRVGDFGFVLGIGLLYAYTDSLHYADVFAKADQLATLTFPGTAWQMLTVACLALFVGAMGKSAQAPPHAWLPGSMAGTTPISRSEEHTSALQSLMR